MKDIKRKKKSQRSNPKNCFPEEAPKYMSLYESFDFLKEVSGLLKLDFTLTEFGGTFFAGFFPDVFFSWIKEKATPEKNSQKLSQ